MFLSSLGLASCLGSDPAEAAAAHRAGIARARSLAYALGDESGEMHAVSGFPLGPGWEGFSPSALWIHSQLEALRNAITFGRLPAFDDGAFWRTAKVFLVFPFTGAGRFPDTEIQTPRLKDLFLARMAEQWGPVFPSANVSLTRAGGAGAAEAILSLMKQGDDAGAAVILAADSLIDQESLIWLESGERLKTPLHAVGAMPGEASVCLVLESAASLRMREQSAGVRIMGAAWKPGLPELDGRERERGALLTQCIRQALATRPGSGSGPYRGDIYLDLNGESWKAKAWAYSQIDLRNEVDFGAANLISPCTAFGEAGAANLPLAVLLAARSLVRGYAGSPHCLAACLSESGEAGAVSLSLGAG